MPYYWWQGVTLTGDSCSGFKFARSESELRSSLARLDIGCMRVRLLALWNVLSPFTLQKKAELLRQWATLLHAGVQLRDALRISAQWDTNKYSKALVLDCAQALEEGIRLSEALQYYPEFCNAFMLSVIAAGEKTADLARGLEQLANHMEKVYQFRQRLRAALFMPGLTFCFFIVLACGFLTLLVPRFEVFFLSFKAPLPYATATLIALSKKMGFRALFYFLAAGIAVCSICYYSIKKNKQSITVFFFTCIPGVKNWYKLLSTTYFLHIMDLLLSGNIQLAQALKLAADSTSDQLLATALNKLTHDIEGGVTLRVAINNNSLFASDYLEALVAVGENTGNLQTVLHHAAAIYQKKVYARLTTITTLVQPVMLVVLGLLIAGLLLALYLPLLTLSHTIM